MILCHYSDNNIILQGGEKMLTFPELRSLMAKYGETRASLGELLGDTYQTFGYKLKNKSQFSFSDMWKIKKHFIEKGEKDLTFDKLFFDWDVAKTTNNAS